MLDIDSLPKLKRQVLKYLIDHPEEAVFLTVRELASKLNVNTSTIVRAVRELGFKGFADFKSRKKEEYKKKLTGYDSMLDKLKTDSPLEEIINKSLISDQNTITQIVNEISREALVEATKKISKSNRTYIIGLEGARSIASFLGPELRTYLPNVTEITYGNGYLFDFIRSFQPDDVVVGISFGKCIRQTVLAVKAAYSRGITTISITDSKLSPLFKFSKIALLTSSSSDFHNSSFVGAMAIANALINCCAEFNRVRSVEMLEKVKKQWEEENIYYLDD